MMVVGTYLKQLLANIFKTEMEAFELKVNACMQEKDKTIKTLAAASETKFKELGRKLEKKKVLFSKISREFKKKDIVIDTLKQRVLENNIENTKAEKKISILLKMV